MMVYLGGQKDILVCIFALNAGHTQVEREETEVEQRKLEQSRRLDDWYEELAYTKYKVCKDQSRNTNNKILTSQQVAGHQFHDSNHEIITN